MNFRILLVLITALLTSGCVSYPPDSPPPGYDQSSPRQTVSYLQWAFENEQPLHVSLCLTNNYMKLVGISPADLDMFWATAKERIEAEIGNVDDIKKVEELFRSPDGKTRIIRYGSGDIIADVIFVLESRYRIVPAKATKEIIEGNFESMESVLKYVDDQAIITLPLSPDTEQLTPSKIHRILIESSWRIDGFESKNAKTGEELFQS